MDFIKSAVASAISKNSSFPYSFGDRVDIDRSIWTLYNGTKKEDGSPCSIFSFDILSDKSRLALAKNALRKLRTLRHPGIVRMLETEETDSHIYIATERLIPLSWQVRRKSINEETAKWGLHTVASTLKFIHEEAASVHGSVRVQSIFVGESGEWKLGGLDILSSMKEDNPVIYNYGNAMPDCARYIPPEIQKTSWDVIKRHPLSAVDSYGLGILIFEVFNGYFNGGDEVGQIKGIPPLMQQAYRRLVNTNPKARLSVEHFLEQGRRNRSFFDTRLIHISEGIENLGLKSENEREEFLQQLEDVSEDFPEEFFRIKVLPELLKSMEYGGGGVKVFNALMKMSIRLSEEEFNAKITPVIVRLFQNSERALRVCLLDNLPLMIDNLSKKTVNDDIFPQLVTGFTDLAPIVREQTLKSILTIITKLTDRTINGELLKCLAKTSNDVEPGIRTNTTICLGKIAKNLGQSTRQKVLVAAFTRALRDPFVHARNAALLALAATCDVFSEDDCVNRILPSLCPALIDKEKTIREQTNKTLEIFLARIRKYAESMPDSVLPPPISTTSASSTPQISSPHPGNSWAGWAISSFTNKLAAAKGQMESSQPDNTSPVVKTAPAITNNRTSSSVSRDISATSRAVPKYSVSRIESPGNKSFDTTPIDPVDDDFDAAWGAMESDDNSEDGNIVSSPVTKPQARPPSPINPFDDGGEPDFEGWLAARAQSKAKKTLPKGMSKKEAKKMPSTIRTTGQLSSTTSHKKAVVGSGSKGAEAKSKIEIKPTEENDDDEGWGLWE